MTQAENLPLAHLGELRVERSRDLRPTSRRTRSYELTPGPERQREAQAALDALAKEWELPVFRARGWLAAADVTLSGPTPLQMYVQLDSTTDLFSLELWADGRVAFGIDDWLGL